MRFTPVLVRCGSGLTARACSRAQEYEAARIRLEPGDSVVLFTDGAVELPGAARRFGIRRLSRMLSEVPDGETWSQTLSRKLVAAAETEDLGDDVTIAKITRCRGS